MKYPAELVFADIAVGGHFADSPPFAEIMFQFLDQQLNARSGGWRLLLLARRSEPNTNRVRTVTDGLAYSASATSPSGTAVVDFTDRMTMRLTTFDTRPRDRMWSRRKSSKACMSRVTMRST